MIGIWEKGKAIVEFTQVKSSTYYQLETIISRVIGENSPPEENNDTEYENVINNVGENSPPSISSGVRIYPYPPHTWNKFEFLKA